MTQLKLTLALLCLAVLSLSCQTPNPTEPIPSEDRGILLASGVDPWSSELVWSKSGDYIYYSTGWPSSIRAVSISDKSTRLLDQRGGSTPTSLTLSADGNCLYYLTEPDTTFEWDLFRINLTTQTSELVISNVRLISFYLSSYVVSPDNNHIAYPSDSSLYLLDLATMVSRRMAVGEPLVFSPDGKEILYRENYLTYKILSCETRATRSISTGVGEADQYNIRLFRWDGRGIRIFYNDLNVRNVSTGTTVRIWTVISPESPENRNYAWSPDGKTIALWTWNCLQGLHLQSCDLAQHSLHIIDIDAQSERRIASGNSSGGSLPTGSIAFSADGRKIAYVLGSDICMKNLQ